MIAFTYAIFWFFDTFAIFFDFAYADDAAISLRRDAFDAAKMIALSFDCHVADYFHWFSLMPLFAFIRHFDDAAMFHFRHFLSFFCFCCWLWYFRVHACRLLMIFFRHADYFRFRCCLLCHYAIYMPLRFWWCQFASFFFIDWWWLIASHCRLLLITPRHWWCHYHFSSQIFWLPDYWCWLLTATPYWCHAIDLFSPMIFFIFSDACFRWCFSAAICPPPPPLHSDFFITISSLILRFISDSICLSHFLLSPAIYLPLMPIFTLLISLLSDDFAFAFAISDFFRRLLRHTRLICHADAMRHLLYVDADTTLLHFCRRHYWHCRFFWLHCRSLIYYAEDTPRCH